MICNYLVTLNNCAIYSNFLTLIQIYTRLLILTVDKRLFERLLTILNCPINPLSRTTSIAKLHAWKPDSPQNYQQYGPLLECKQLQNSLQLNNPLSQNGKIGQSGGKSWFCIALFDRVRRPIRVRTD